jgi:hypothetical protein
MKTRGVHSDQLAAAIQATEHALNLIALHRGEARRPARRTRGARRPLSRIVKPAV